MKWNGHEICCVLAATVALITAGGPALGAAGAPKPTLDLAKEIEEKCGLPPIAQVQIDGATATKEEMEEAKYQALQFQTDSDSFQDCVLRVAASENNKQRLKESDGAIVVKLIDRSQQEKVATIGALNQSIDAYNAHHHLSGSAALGQTGPAQSTSPGSHPK